MPGAVIVVEPVRIDGSLGEGGGQLLRLSASLSVVTGVPVRIDRIRAGRKRPGLGAQHAAALRVLARLCGARTSGVRRGSQSVLFEPGQGGENIIEEDVGTAGSIPLILQAALPAALSGRRVRLRIRGGTDVPWSPTLDYVERVLCPALARFGVRASVRALRRGYYPRGGGIVEASAEGAARPALLDGRPEKFFVACAHSGIEGAEEAAASAASALEETGLPVSLCAARAESDGPGGSLLACAQGKRCHAGTDSLWNGGFEDVSARLRGCLAVDENLSDMLVLPACASDGTSSWTVSRVTAHLESALRVAAQITGCRYGAGRIKVGYEVRVKGVRS